MGATKPNATIAARASLALSSHGLSAHNSIVLQEGWVLKKRRKKMQGFARRYFVLYASGLLCYSFEPGQSIRDSVSLHSAAISTAPGRKDIHVDSQSATFHIKCLSTDDFNLWMVALRKFTNPTPEVRRSGSMRVTARQESSRLLKSTAVVEEMSATLEEMQDAFNKLEVAAEKRIAQATRHKGDKAFHSLFSKRSSNNSPPIESATESGFLEHGVPDQAYFQRMRIAIETFKDQHTLLTKSLVSEAGQSSLPFTGEEDEDSGSTTYNIHRAPTTPSRRSKRASTATSINSSIQEWYDADDGLDGAQEFTIDELNFDDTEPTQPSTITSDTRSSADDGDTSSMDTDILSERPISPSVPDPIGTQPLDVQAVARRTELPSLPVGDEGSLFTILKKNVGKDLSTIAFPVTFNEPLTLLQRAAEEVEYYDILNLAAGSSDPVDRMRYVAAFAVSQYAHTRHRTGRKGFNPMLAETFEDTRMKFIAEKVRHVPLEMAYHAEGEGWEIYATSSGKTKFWGKSLEIIPLGTTHLQMGDDHFQWKKPSSFMRNLMMGTKYLEHCGKMDIENVNDQSRCVLDFKQSGYWAASNTVTATLYSASGQVVSEMEGKWDDQFAEVLGPSHLRVLWRASPWPKNTDDYYGFTSFGITLNEITSDIQGKLPPTDSRLRSDVRALEDGELDTAEQEKARIEEMQRDRRRKGQEVQPRWFKQDGDEWVYIGGYWEARAKDWQGMNIQALW